MAYVIFVLIFLGLLLFFFLGASVQQKSGAHFLSIVSPWGNDTAIEVISARSFTRRRRVGTRWTVWQGERRTFNYWAEEAYSPQQSAPW